MMKRIIGLVRSSGGFVLIGILVVSTWLFLGATIEYHLPLYAFNKFYGEVSRIDYKHYECMGSGRYGRYRTGRCEMTDINLKNIRADFHVASEAGGGGYIGNIEVGDTITILRRHWYQYPLTFGSINDIYHVEKNGEILYYYGWRRSENYGTMIICGPISILFLILFLVERQTHKILSQVNDYKKKIQLHLPLPVTHKKSPRKPPALSPHCPPSPRLPCQWKKLYPNKIL